MVRELPSIIPSRILDQVAIKDSLKRIEVQTPTGNQVKNVIMPAINHFNQTKIIEKILPTTKPNENQIKYCSYFRFGYHKPPFARHLIRIKRRKMKKHHLRKWRKKYLSVILNKAKTREIRKEKTFRTELLTEIKKAENFSAEKYVDGVIRTIEKAPKENTESSLNELFDLIRKHKFETTIVRPKFDDKVPTEFDKIK